MFEKTQCKRVFFKGRIMKLEKANELVKQLETKGNLGQHIKKGLVCGSIRRKKPEVHDIDWVIIKKPESEYKFGEETLDMTIERLDQGLQKPVLGSKIKRFYFRGEQIELYIANEKTFETLVLIRTGSTEHNVRLTKLARSKFLKLYANGSGLCKIKGGLYNNEPEEIMEVIEDTEKGILQYLLGRVPEPEQRD